MGGVIDDIGDAIGDVGDAIGDTVTDIGDDIGDVIRDTGDFFQDLGDDIGQLGKDVWNEMETWDWERIGLAAGTFGLSEQIRLGGDLVGKLLGALGPEAEGGADLRMPPTADPFDFFIREAAMSRLKNDKRTGRGSTFVTGPRGLEGPMNNVIMNGGTSLMGRSGNS